MTLRCRCSVRTLIIVIQCSVVSNDCSDPCTSLFLGGKSGRAAVCRLHGEGDALGHLSTLPQGRAPIPRGAFSPAVAGSARGAANPTVARWNFRNYSETASARGEAIRGYTTRSFLQKLSPLQFLVLVIESIVPEHMSHP